MTTPLIVGTAFAATTAVWLAGYLFGHTLAAGNALDAIHEAQAEQLFAELRREAAEALLKAELAKPVDYA